MTIAERIFRALFIARDRGLTSYELAEVVYADDETGGPVDVSNVLCVHIFGLRRTLWPHGATIRSEKGRNARHRLEMLQCEDANGRTTMERRRTNAAAAVG